MYQKTLFILSILTVFAFSACKTKKIPIDNSTIIIDGNTGSNGPIIDKDTSKSVVIVDTPTITIDTLVNLDTVPNIKELKKDSYNVAIILPFMEDSVRNNWSKAKPKNFDEFFLPNEADISASFIEGFLMALEDLSFGSRFNITFYDDYNSETHISSILKQLETNTPDIIIGPYLRSNILKINEFAMDKDILVLSPFSPSKSASNGNSNYYMFEPSLEQHILNMLTYVEDSLPNYTVKFFYQDNKAGQEYANLVANFFDQRNAIDSNQYINYATINIPQSSFKFKISDYVDIGEQNVLIFNTFDQNAIHLVVRQTNQLVKKNEDIVAFGMPNWENNETIRLDYMNNVQFHFTKSYWIQNDEPQLKLFAEKFKDKYGKKPQAESFKGYDMASIMFPLIDQHGLYLNQFLSESYYEGIIRDYNFVNVLTKSNTIHRMENTSIYIYKIEEYEPILVR